MKAFNGAVTPTAPDGMEAEARRSVDVVVITATAFRVFFWAIEYPHDLFFCPRPKRGSGR